MTTWFVSRHPAAAEWARKHRHIDEHAQCVPSLEPGQVHAGDRVVGNLPAQVAAAVCGQGAVYDHLAIDLALEQRGLELTVADLEAAQATVERFVVEKVLASPHAGRRNLHVCVVSDQTLPTILPLRLKEQLGADVIVLLASREMAAAAERLKVVLHRFGLPAPDIRSEVPDHDIASIAAYGRCLAAELRDRYPRHRLLLNLTGGTKLMTLGLHQGMRTRFEMYYCDTRHDRLEWINTGSHAEPALDSKLLSLREYLWAQGFEPDFPAVQQANEDQRKAAAYLANAAKTVRHDFFRRLNKAALARDPARKFDAGASPRLVLASQSMPELQTAETLGSRGLLSRHADDGWQVQDSEAAWRFLGGGWLEVYCGVVAKRLEAEGLGQHQWKTNVRVSRLGATATVQELDAVVVHRNRMLIIECKTGQQLASGDTKEQEILNKLEVVGDQIAGSLGTRWLLTTADSFSPAVVDRARRYKIRLFKADELNSLEDQIRQWMDA
jgi:putative CRISPR-associated protein (TIGR02620 family)